MQCRLTEDRIAGCHTWASDLHASLEQLCAELDDLGQHEPAKRMAIAKRQLELVCDDLGQTVAKARREGSP